MVTQTAVYYVSFKRDHKWIKILVAWLFVIDTFNTIFDVGLIWRYTITLFGDTEAIVHSSWWFNVEPVMTTMISSTTQSFFAWRIARLTGHNWLGYLIGCSAFIQLAAGLGSTIGASIVRDFNRFQELKAAVITWLGLSAITDVVITCILSWYLHTHRTGFSKTDDIITRLVRLTVQTGFITTVWAATDLVLYLGLENNLHLFFQLPLCKLYTNSLMSTLNSRNGWGGSFASGETGDPASRSGGAAGQGQTNRTGAAVWRPEHAKSQTNTGIQVITTATVHRDDGFELDEYAADSKKPGNDDVENYPHTGTTVQLPGVASKSAISDEASLHSTFDGK
ncbi:hypothetical protein FRC10_006276 [Ceratobasidium sp. 414]|nr:hypothetical protein FRC10_006276 [Ceratobasidium sp. 414]